MHNISIGDIFTNLEDIYRVLALHQREESPDDPFIEAEVFVSDRGFTKGDNYSVGSCGFTLTEAKNYALNNAQSVTEKNKIESAFNSRTSACSRTISSK